MHQTIETMLFPRMQPSWRAPQPVSVVAATLRVRQKLSYAFVALKLAWGEARGKECIRSDTRPTEPRSPRPISAQPAGRQFFFAQTLLLAPYRPTRGMLVARA